MFEIIADLEKRLAAHMAAHNLTPPQFYVLKTLTEEGGHCRIGRIAQQHHLTNATMTGLVKRLEVMKLVQRVQSDNDGRAVDVFLTPEGGELYWAIQRSLMEQARAVLSLLPHQERQAAIEKVQLYFRLLAEQFPVSSPR